ncbi:MAG: dihydrodipicolinate synthase family protein [Anaerolineales bacterium]|nr:dihydrodipicolinate synthase family protein [Anaerolineales bacterium]
MSLTHPLAGVYAAAVTPCSPSGEFDPQGMHTLLDFLAARGCHGSLLLGTTGEGPSFSTGERLAIWGAAAAWRQGQPGFRLLAGTGTPSLGETIELTRAAFELGFEAAVVLPPYFIRNASEDGLFDWYAALIEAAVPDGRTLLGYHIPAVSGVALPLSLLQRLAAAYGEKFGGLKDSSGSLESAQAYIAGLPGKAVLVGSDKLLAAGLASGATGCITALANMNSAEARAIYDAHARGEDTAAMQAELDIQRNAMESMPPAPAYLKALLHTHHGLPRWAVKPPLRDFSAEQVHQATAL